MNNFIQCDRNYSESKGIFDINYILSSRIELISIVKSGDYYDIYVNTYSGKRFLFKNNIKDLSQAIKLVEELSKMIKESKNR